MKKQINGQLIDMTAEEVSARQADETQEAIDQQSAIDATTAAAKKKASGKQKLLDLGLTEAEVKALIGA